MALKTALYYGAIAIAILIAVSIVVSVVSTIVGWATALVVGAIQLAILVGIVYAAYKAGSWMFGGSDDAYATDSIGRSRSSSSSSTSAGSDSQSRQDRLRQQYVEGQISEAEFEERIARELESEEFDDIDQELERER